MTIDPETGVVDLPELGGALGPTTLRDAWLASPAGQGCAVGVHNEPWCSYGARDFADGESRWKLGAWFHGQTLWRVTAMALLDEPGTGWDRLSMAGELARREWHEQWLTRALGRARSFPWGTAASVFDERGGSSSILVEYAVRAALFPGQGG